MEKIYMKTLKAKPVVAAAYSYAESLDTDTLFTKFNTLSYPTLGFPAVLLYKVSDQPMWKAGLRNEEFSGVEIICAGSTAKQAMVALFAYCVYKNYLKLE
jgi:hypothetical protein